MPGLVFPFIFFYFLFRLSLLLERGTAEKKYYSPRWTVDGFCFPAVRADFGLKEGRPQLVFESAFCGSAMLFVVEELAVNDSTRVS